MGQPPRHAHICLEKLKRRQLPNLVFKTLVTFTTYLAKRVFAEVIPSKIFEAMAMGVPILLVTPQGIASDIVLSTRTGVWIPSEKPDRLATIVTKLRHKKHLLGQLSRNGIKNSVQFGRRRQAEEMLQTLEIAAAGWRNAGVSSDYRKTW